MFKKAERLFQKKENLQISIILTRIGAVVDNDATLHVVWKRGKAQSDESIEFDINSIQEDVDCDFIFSRVSSFFKSGDKYDKKMCDFEIYCTQEGKKR